MMLRIQRALADDADRELHSEVLSELRRMLRMFYLDAKVKGFLKEFKSDYFV